MKYLYYDKINLNPIRIILKQKNQPTIEREDLTIEECFKLKNTGEYEIINIQTCGLYYKTCKSSKKRIELHGEINLFEFENGGNWENMYPIK